MAIAGVALAGVWIASHAGYYFSPIHVQALHGDHDALRSSSALGLGLGVAGSTCFVANLLYLVRRRLLWMERLGSLRLWLHLHVLSGLTGGILILLHSAFSIRSTIGGIAFVTLLIVLLAGAVGRYIHALIPRTLEGSARRYEQVGAMVQELTVRLEERGVHVSLPAAVDPVPPESIFEALHGLLLSRPALQRERRMVQAALSERSTGERADELRDLVRQFLESRRQLLQYHQLRRLMASWRFLHRWLALVMLGAALFHVLIVLQYL